jgi:hypothetical protein
LKLRTFNQPILALGSTVSRALSELKRLCCYGWSWASEASGRDHGVVVCWIATASGPRPYQPARAWDEGLWLGWAWMALFDIDKYLRRDSLWTVDAIGPVELFASSGRRTTEARTSRRRLLIASRR